MVRVANKADNALGNPLLSLPASKLDNRMGKIREYVRVNGWYLLLDEILARTGAIVRGGIISRRAGTRGLRLGSGSYICGLGCMQIGPDLHAGRGLWLQAITRHRDQRFTPEL